MCIAILNVDVNMSIYLQYCRPVGHRGAAVAILSDSTREQPRSVPVPRKRKPLVLDLNLEELS